jgi:hypothetical protein
VARRCVVTGIYKFSADRISASKGFGNRTQHSNNFKRHGASGGHRVVSPPPPPPCPLPPAPSAPSVIHRGVLSASFYFDFNFGWRAGEIDRSRGEKSVGIDKRLPSPVPQGWIGRWGEGGEGMILSIAAELTKERVKLDENGEIG